MNCDVSYLLSEAAFDSLSFEILCMVADSLERPPLLEREIALVPCVRATLLEHSKRR